MSCLNAIVYELFKCLHWDKKKMSQCLQGPNCSVPDHQSDCVSFLFLQFVLRQLRKGGGHSHMLMDIKCLSIDPPFLRRPYTQWPPFLHFCIKFYIKIAIFCALRVHFETFNDFVEIFTENLQILPWNCTFAHWMTPISASPHQKKKPFPGGHSNGKRGYQARPWTHKKHPNHVLFRYEKKDPKYAFLHAFFLICLSCRPTFQNLSNQKHTIFSNFARFCTPKQCTRVQYLVLKNNPN